MVGSWNRSRSFRSWHRPWAVHARFRLMSNVQLRVVSEPACRRENKGHFWNSCLFPSSMQGLCPNDQMSSRITLFRMTWNFWRLPRHGSLLIMAKMIYWTSARPVINAVHTPRVGKRGGGMALIYRSSLRAEMATTGFSASSFEHMAVRLLCNLGG
jgi:hypothetical protein